MAPRLQNAVDVEDSNGLGVTMIEPLALIILDEKYYRAQNSLEGVWAMRRMRRHRTIFSAAFSQCVLHR